MLTVGISGLRVLHHKYYFIIPGIWKQVIFGKPRCPQVTLNTFVTFLAYPWNAK